MIEELAGSPTLRIDANGTASARRLFRCAWADYPALVASLWGQRTVRGGIVVTLAARASFPGMPALGVAGIAIEPFDPQSPDGGIADLDFSANTYGQGGAKVTVDYKILNGNGRNGKGGSGGGSDPDPNLPISPEDDTYTEWERDIGVEVLHVPGRFWAWESAGSVPIQEDLPVGIQIPTVAHTLRWRHTGDVPEATIRACRGAINAQTFLGVPPECLLFVGARVTEYFDQDLIRNYDIDYSFLERTPQGYVSGGGAIGWNHFLHPATSATIQWEKVVQLGDNSRFAYPTADFTSLLRYDPPGV